MARESSIQGTVYVTFVVERDGSVTDVRVLRGIGGGCDEEAIRVIKAMPKWNPGKQRGKPVRVQFNMPIKFTLAG
jgi:protein TonB